MSLSERTRHYQIVNAGELVARLNAAHREEAARKAKRVSAAHAALKNAERIGRNHLVTFSSANGSFAPNTVKLFEHELRNGKRGVPLRGMTVRIENRGGVTVDTRPTIGRTVAGAVIGHAIGSQISSRRDAGFTGGVTGALIGANMEKTTETDSRYTALYFEVDGVAEASVIAFDKDRYRVAAFTAAITAAQAQLDAFEAERGPAVAAAQAQLTAAEADGKPAMAAAALASARTELVKLNRLASGR